MTQVDAGRQETEANPQIPPENSKEILVFLEGKMFDDPIGDQPLGDSRHRKWILRRVLYRVVLSESAADCMLFLLADEGE